MWRHKSIPFSNFEREVISILCWGSLFKVLYEKIRSKILATRDLDRAIYTQTETQTYRHTDRACSGLYYIYIYYFIYILIWLNIKITFLWFHVWSIPFFCEALKGVYQPRLTITTMGQPLFYGCPIVGNFQAFILTW